jgi:hypothetical protein
MFLVSTLWTGGVRDRAALTISLELEDINAVWTLGCAKT